MHRLDHHYAPNGFPVSNCRAGGVIIGGQGGRQGLKNTEKKGYAFLQKQHTALFSQSSRFVLSPSTPVCLPSTFTHAFTSRRIFNSNIFLAPRYRPTKTSTNYDLLSFFFSYFILPYFSPLTPFIIVSLLCATFL